ncbi:MAG: PAN domain-containing protein [Burkholderiaceae bacterium]
MRGYELQGTALRDFSSRSEDECRRTCAPEPLCRGWTFSRGGAGSPYEDYGPNPGRSDSFNMWMREQKREHLRHRCFLFSDPGHPRYNGGAVSGIKPPPPAVAGRRPEPPVVRRN